METDYVIVPRARAYWIEAVATNGSRRVVGRYDTEDKATAHLRMLRDRAEIPLRRALIDLMKARS